MDPVRTSLCLPTRVGFTGQEVLLGLKQTGFGTGRVVALGGKIEPGETAVAAAVRELAEESGLIADEARLAHVARVRWNFPYDDDFVLSAEVFHVEHWRGELEVSDEITPRWYPIDEVPYTGMWADSSEWLPLVLSGGRVNAEFVYDSDNVSLQRSTVVPLRTEGDRPASG